MSRPLPPQRFRCYPEARHPPGGPLFFRAQRAGAGGKHEESYTEAQRAAIEQAEDTFVEKVDEATSVMHNVLDTPEPLHNLSELVRAQAEYHARAAEILEEVSKNIGDIQMEQESNWRKARDQ